MRDEAKTKKQLITELHELRQFIAELLDFHPDSPDLTDLNKLKESSRQMKKNHEKFMKFFLQNALPMGLTTQKEGCFVEVNDTFLKLTGFKRSDVIGSTVTGLGLITDEQRASLLDKLNGKGRVENIEVRLLAKNRKPVHGLLNVVLMSLGREKYRLLVMTDITALKQAGEDKTREAQTPCRLPIDRPMPWFIN